MVFEPAAVLSVSPRARGLAALVVTVLLGACAGGERYFPLRAAMTVDTDLRPVTVECEVRPDDDDPNHVSCAPEPYVSPLVWDGLDNSLFRPLTRIFAVESESPAVNVNAFDEVPDSSWFTNRLGKRTLSRDELLRGACQEDQLLDGLSASEGSWRIDRGKPNGASPGFRIRVGGQKYMLKTDSVEQPERPSAASAIGAAIYHAAGYHTSCEQIVYFDPKVLKLDPGLTATDNSGVERPFDQAALRWVLDQATPRGNLLRMQASAWLPGYLLGPFRYEGTRSDDPNDVIPHQHRRELRGGRVIAAWINHFDAREQNSMDTWIAADPTAKDSSPGHVRHYYLDTSDSFGSEWAWDGISRRLGRSYVLDFGDIALDFVTFGTQVRSWERAERTPGLEAFGYFHYRDFDPDEWKNEYPNPAFSNATEHDNAWMARILSRLDYQDIEALVSLGEFSNPLYSVFLTEVLEYRLRRIVSRYLSRLSPLADFSVAGKNRLCATDLLRRRAARPGHEFRYRASLHNRHGKTSLSVDRLAGGRLCSSLPHAPPHAAPPGDPSRYAVVVIENGAARFPIYAHLYDLGPGAGYRLVGLERPESAEVDLAHVGW